MRQSHSFRGVALFMLCLLLFACLDTTTKYLATYYEVPLIIAARFTVNLLLMAAILVPRHGAEMVRVDKKGWVLARALALSVASCCMGFALQRMPIAEATAILYLAPIVVILAAGPLLGERIGGASYVAAALGFCGVLLIARPGGGLDPVGVALAATAMLANATYQLLSRKLIRTERTIALLFYTVLTGTVIFGAAAPWFIDGRVPSALELGLFASLGVYGGLGHFLFTAAYRDTSASLLAPLNYAQLLFVGVLGWLVFGHVPDMPSLIGMAVIAAAGIVAAAVARPPTVKRSV